MNRYRFDGAWRAAAVWMASPFFLWLALAAPVQASPDPHRQDALRELVRQDCGACHGLRLHGGLGSPLTPAALADKPGDSLVATLLDGRPGTAMPPWRPFISPAEAVWLIDELKRGLPPLPESRP